jgi:hypothetical protein
MLATVDESQSSISAHYFPPTMINIATTCSASTNVASAGSCKFPCQQRVETIALTVPEQTISLSKGKVVLVVTNSTTLFTIPAWTGTIATSYAAATKMNFAINVSKAVAITYDP